MSTIFCRTMSCRIPVKLSVIWFSNLAISVSDSSPCFFSRTDLSLKFFKWKIRFISVNKESWPITFHILFKDISLYTIVEIIEIEIGAQVLQPGRTPFPLFRHGTGMYLKHKMEIKKVIIST